MQKELQKLEALIERKQKQLALYPNKYAAEDLSILKECFEGIMIFVEKDYNPLANFISMLNYFITEQSISQPEMIEILKSDAPNKEKKEAILRASARTYWKMYDEAESKYSELYFFIQNGRLDLAMKKIDAENEILAFWNERLLQLTGQPLHRKKEDYTNYKPL